MLAHTSLTIIEKGQRYSIFIFYALYKSFIVCFDSNIMLAIFWINNVVLYVFERILNY